MTSNPNREQALEIKAGIFVLIGLVFIAVMAFKFGRVGQGLFQSYYTLTITFPTADGLIKNSDVQLAGARIGYVGEKPTITPGGSGVTIPVQILSGVRIPRATTFEVGSSGLLGDKFVDIKPTAAFNPAAYNPADPKQVLAPNEIVAGAAAGGPLGALQSKAEQVFDDLKVEIQHLTEVTDKINTGILSQQNQRNITDTFSNLKSTSEHFNTGSKNLDTVIVGAQQTIDSARTTLSTVNSAAADLRVDLASLKDLLIKAQTGPGPISTLLNDRQLADNLRALIANLREHGLLFYKNRASSSSTQPPPAPARASSSPARQF